MANQRMSVATVDSPEFLNITSISPLISKCEIKVLYVGENRNRSFITKEVATKMAATLPGSPIVGYYIENKEDFGDHGDQIVINGEGIHFSKLTQPYGFVAPDSKIWFKKFNDTDEFGNSVVREYLMTEGYLWTGQYEEAKRVISQGNPQSMELDEETLKGYWSEDTNRGIDFFIINDAIFSKLCILGEDVEPCFEGADITAPKLSISFNKESNFTNTLFTMMKELKDALNEKGGKSMENEVNVTDIENTENFSNTQVNLDETDFEKNQDTVEDEFSKKNPEEDKESDKPEDKETEDESKSDDEEDKEKKVCQNSKNEEEDDEEKEKKPCQNSLEAVSKEEYELIQSELETLKNDYALLKAENDELKEYKNQVEDEQKDQLIASFSMLSDEDKKDIIINKAKYSLKEIKAELSILCVDKKVNFNVESQDARENVASVTYNLNSHESSSLPAYLQRVVDMRKSKED